MINELRGLTWQTQAALGIVLVALLGFALLRRRRAASGTFDKRFASVVMLAGLAWSAEAMYDIATTTFGIEKVAALAVCSVFEAALWLLMRRAERAMEEFQWPGKAGRYVWMLAGLMGFVAAANAHRADSTEWSAGAATFRLAIPIVVTALWWSGMVGETAKPEGEESTWLWTPGKVLVRFGLKAPGKSDVAKVQRDWLTERMTKLEFVRQFGPEAKRDKVKMKLARLALSADQEIIEVVRGRVRLASAALSGELSALSDEVVRTELSAPAEPVRTDKPTTDIKPDEDVRAAQGLGLEMTDDDRRQMLASLISKDNPATGKEWTVRDLSDVLGCGRTKVSEMKRDLVRRADNEVINLTPGFFDYQNEPGTTKVNGNVPELESAR